MLADVQARLHRAVVAGDSEPLPDVLAGGRRALGRFGIHQRHYEASLSAALVTKYPATAWLLGPAFVAEAVRRFVHDHPPRRPCVAEYGAEFPVFLAGQPGAVRLPYLQSFAELEWHMGQASIAVDAPARPIDALAAVPPDTLGEVRLTLQSGLRYLVAAWPVDRLMYLYLTDSAPDRLPFAPDESWLEVRGARGRCHVTRLEQSEFLFRELVAAGRPIGAAAEAAAQVHRLDAPGFDPGGALSRLFVAGLVTGVRT